MANPSRAPVLVTGSNRSGTTWVGRMLCLSRELSYLHEPFNPGIWPRSLAQPIPFRNLYVTADNEDRFLSATQAMVERRVPVREQLREIRSPVDAARLARAWARGSWSRRRTTASLVKDPIAVFSSEWLAQRLGMRVVMMVRGPLAFAGSIKRLGWAFDFNQWTAQPLLMRDHLGEFSDQIRRAAQSPPGLVEQAILTWNATYAYVASMQTAHPDWHFVGYERLAAAPADGFRALYEALDLTFDERAAQGIARHSDRTNQAAVPSGDKGGIRRDSAAAIDTWRTRLTEAEVALVNEGTSDVARRLDVVVGGGR